MINNRNTNIVGAILFIFTLIFVSLRTFVQDKEPSYTFIGMLLFFVVVLYSIKNPKIQDMLVKILDKLPIKLK